MSTGAGPGRRALALLAMLGLGLGLRVGLVVALGMATGLATGWLHSRWWSYALATAATLTTLRALRPGLPRIAYALAWLAPLGWLVRARPEGDYVVAGDLWGYAYIGLGTVVLIAALVTLPPPRRRRPAGTAPREATTSA